MRAMMITHAKESENNEYIISSHFITCTFELISIFFIYSFRCWLLLSVR